MKTLSTIGLVIFCLALLVILGTSPDIDMNGIIAWGAISSLYGIALSIVFLAKNKKCSKTCES